MVGSSTLSSNPENDLNNQCFDGKFKKQFLTLAGGVDPGVSLPFRNHNSEDTGVTVPKTSTQFQAPCELSQPAVIQPLLYIQSLKCFCAACPRYSQISADSGATHYIKATVSIHPSQALCAYFQRPSLFSEHLHLSMKFPTAYMQVFIAVMIVSLANALPLGG